MEKQPNGMQKRILCEQTLCHSEGVHVWSWVRTHVDK